MSGFAHARPEARAAIFEYVEALYDRQRRRAHVDQAAAGFEERANRLLAPCPRGGARASPGEAGGGAAPQE
jgi:hypothetical protein